VSNPAREGELTTRLPLGNVTSCKGLRRGQRLPPKHSSDKAETGLKCQALVRPSEPSVDGKAVGAF